MSRAARTSMSSRALRAEVGARNLLRGAEVAQEVTFGQTPSVVYAGSEDGGHGNFLPASYRRIVADPAWAARLEKTYTGGARLPRSRDRWRGELECAVSSDALLMNLFCYPGVLRRSAVCAFLGVGPGLRPEFGVRAGLPMAGGEVDRTEFDMAVADVYVEAKLTESGFGTATPQRLQRYMAVDEIFSRDALPLRGNSYLGYQVIRGVLAAAAAEGRYLVLLDGRRSDLLEICFRVLCATHGAEVRSRFRVATWQELSGLLPPKLQVYLEEKYGILPVAAGIER